MLEKNNRGERSYDEGWIFHSDLIYSKPQKAQDVLSLYQLISVPLVMLNDRQVFHLSTKKEFLLLLS